jgi:hypothetical protein
MALLCAAHLCCPETGFETISLHVNDHTDRGVGGRQYGASKDIETLQGKNNASTRRPGAVKECSSSLASSQESYRHAIDEFIGWYCSEPRLSFSRTVVLRYRFFLEQNNLGPSTINVRLAAVRRLAYEASRYWPTEP